MKRALLITGLSTVILALSACSPEIGSEKWCAAMKEKPKGEWTANEAGDFAKYCVLHMEKETEK